MYTYLHMFGTFLMIESYKVVEIIIRLQTLKQKGSNVYKLQNL